MRMKELSQRVRKAKKPSEYLSILLASIDEINKFQESRGCVGENWKLKQVFFPAYIDKIPGVQFYEFLKTLHLLQLQDLLPTTAQVIDWRDKGYIVF